QEDTLPRPQGEDLGLLSKYFEGSQKYLSYLQDTVDNDFTDLYIGLDCANGATSSLATRLFADQDVEEATIGNKSNETNSNDGYGSTHPEKMQARVKEKGLDVGHSVDGDGDRLIAVDEKGNILDGHKILDVCAKYLKENNQLEEDTVV